MSDQAPRPRRRGWITPTALLVLAALAATAAFVDLPVQPVRGWWPVAIMLGLVAAAVAAWELR